MTQQELEKYLWGAATTLRGTIDAGDYKQYIFPLLFFKRICDVYEEEFETAMADSDGDLEYAAFEENHRFQIPAGAHWKEVRETTVNVGLAIQEAMRNIEKANPETLYGIFGDASWTNKNRLSDEMLINLVEHFSQQKLNLASVPDDQLGNAYEYLIKEFADDSGHTAAEFYTNRTVVKLMTMIMAPQPGESVYDPTCGSGGLLLNCALHLRDEGKEYRTLKLYGQEINLLTSAIARMNMFMHGIEEFQIIRGDTLTRPALLEKTDHHLERKIALDVETMVYYWKYIKLPLQLEREKETIIDLKKVFRLVKTFSDYLIPCWIPKPKKFVGLFGGDGLLSIFEADQLCEGIQAYFGWEADEVKNIIDFLTLDLLAGKKSSPDFLTHPFLKIGNQYLWISSFLTGRRWDVILHRRVIADKIIKNTGFLASQLEVELADNFRNAGFGAMASYEYKLSNDKKGEVDILAYKEKTLFVIELKTTYIIEDLMRYEKYHAQTFEDKAVQQLERSIEYIQSNFEKLSRRKQLKIDCTLEELQIVPLVVSNIFEMDNVILGKGIQKISLFELLVILNDDLGYLYGEAKDLWSQAESCSAMDLFDAIKEQKVWRRMFQIKKSEALFDSLLAPYDRTQPYLTRFW